MSGLRLSWESHADPTACVHVTALLGSGGGLETFRRNRKEGDSPSRDRITGRYLHTTTRLNLAGHTVGLNARAHS